jgi:hypothetical protein
VSRTPRSTAGRLRAHVGAGARGDLLGDRVGLLRGQPALFDGERDRVARRQTVMVS